MYSVTPALNDRRRRCPVGGMPIDGDVNASARVWFSLITSNVSS